MKKKEELEKELIKKKKDEFRKILNDVFEEMKTCSRVFSNEAQLQYELAVRLKDKKYEDLIHGVELEVLSSNLKVEDFNKMSDSEIEKNKFYTDIVVNLGEEEYVAIELKFKTPEYGKNVKIKKHIVKNTDNEFYTFSQGAETEGGFLFWSDVARLEKFGKSKEENGILLNFNDSKKVIQKFAILMTNAKRYWTRESSRDSLCENFFPVEYSDDNTKTQKVFSGNLCWKIKVCIKNGEEYRVSGRTSTKRKDCEVNIKELAYDEHDKFKNYYVIKSGEEKIRELRPIHLEGEYKCDWKDYLELEDETKFRYLILEVK